MASRVLALVAFLALGNAFLTSLQTPPPPPPAAPPTIDHEAVSCAEADEFPQIGATIESTLGIGAARVFFKSHDQTDWYYVDMSLLTPPSQYVAHLPRPLPGTQFDYYLLALDSRAEISQTQEWLVTVNDQGCDRNLLPFGRLPVGQISVVPTVAGQAIVPPGFGSLAIAGVATGGGIGAGTIAAIAAGAGAAATIPIVTGGGDGDGGGTGGGDAPTPTTPTPTTPTPTTPTPTTPTPTTPTPAGPNNAPRLFFTITPDPATGPAPLTVGFSMCGSFDPDGDTLQFRINWGDGASNGLSGNCAASHTYAQGNYVLTGCVTDQKAPEVCADELVGAAGPPPYPVGAARRLTWVNDLQVPGAQAQVVVDGTQVSYPASGRSHGVAELRSRPGRPEVRIEAQIVAASGEPGTWEFSFRTLEGSSLVAPGSVRVIAGDVLALTQDGIVFRVSGEPGERLVFSVATR